MRQKGRHREEAQVIRCLVCVLLLFSASAASADPILLLLLRFARDQAISASVEAGVGAMQRGSTIPSPVYGFALPTPPIPQGTEEQRIRALIDESFLHLSAAQRDEVFAGMQKILDDPQYKQIKLRIVAEFTLKARAARESYLSIDRLSHSEKRVLAMQAKEEFRRLPAEDRQQLLGVLQSGMLPVPRDFNDILLAEFNTIPPVAGNDRRRD
jgi:hypothetical protein